MKANSFGLFFGLFITITGCTESKTNAQTRNNITQDRVGGQCEGCEAVYENSTPFTNLDWQLTLPDYNDKGPKLEVTGTVYKPDGKTPAAGIILYFYHTDQSGNYPPGNEKGWGRRHGYIRGWLKTNATGQYSIRTLKPASYPNRQAAAHIHCIVKENNLNEYYIGDFLFDDDPLLSNEEKSGTKVQGGNGVLKLQEKNGILLGTRNIYLGKNISNYPMSSKQSSDYIFSGLAIGADCPAFDPVHVSGPDKGKSACPMCKYGRGQGIMVWWNKAGIDELSSFAKKLEQDILDNGTNKLRVFIMYMNPAGKTVTEINRMLDGFSRKNNLQNVAITYVPSPTDPETAGLYKINPKANNTVFIYNRRKVIAKFINYNIDNGQMPLVQKLNLQPATIL